VPNVTAIFLLAVVGLDVISQHKPCSTTVSLFKSLTIKLHLALFVVIDDISDELTDM
jgi:hypothetical protein